MCGTSPHWVSILVRTLKFGISESVPSSACDQAYQEDYHDDYDKQVDQAPECGCYAAESKDCEDDEQYYDYCHQVE